MMSLAKSGRALRRVLGLRAHLAKRGYGDLDIKMTGGYDPNSTSPDSRLIQAQGKARRSASAA